MSIEPFRQLADLLPEALLIVSGDGTVRVANRAVANLGIDPRRLTGARLAEVVADPPEEVARTVRACGRTREPVLGTLSPRRDDGRAVACRVEGSVLRPRSDGAEPLVVLRMRPKDAAIAQFLELNQRIDALAREVARRRRAERELNEQREWLHVILSSIGDAVLATDTEGRVSFLNPVAETLTGWTRDEAIGQPLEAVFRIVNEQTRRPVESPVGRALREGLVVGLANHTVLIARDGTERAIDDSAAPIRAETGDLQGVVLVFHDVGDRRKLEQELRHRAEALAEADRRKDQFLAMLAHELRNPLAPVANTIEVLRAGGADGATLDWATEIMGRQVRHMARLVDDLLDVSRITHGKIGLRPEPIDLATVLKHAVDSAGPSLAARRHELTVIVGSEPMPMVADPTRLEQVVCNLLDNAAKYTPEGGRITLSAGRDGAEAVIRVRDTGVGMTAELVPRVFDLFLQADRSLARAEGGLGIGLTLARNLLALHGGTIEGRSDGPGLGSEFIVRLPLATPAAPTPEPAGTEAPGPPAGPRRVLLVDDNLDSARSLARILKLWGHAVRVAHDGPTALVEADEFRPDVVLLDIGLPGLDGHEVARRLHAVDGHRPALLIALTGYGQEADRQQSLRAGFDHHLVKPVDLPRLRALLDRAEPGPPR